MRRDAGSLTEHPLDIQFSVGADLLRESYRGVNPLPQRRRQFGRYAANVTYFRTFDARTRASTGRPALWLVQRMKRLRPPRWRFRLR